MFLPRKRFMKTKNGKIGNIIVNGSGKKYPKIFNIGTTFGDIDASLPTLIIGLHESKALLGKRFSIIERRPKDKLWWTYKKTERNYDYETDYEDFYRHCIQLKLGKIEYRYVDFTRYRYSKLKSFINYIGNRKQKICFITRDRNFVFIYVPTDSIVLGLSLNLLEYCNISKEKTIRKLKSNKSNTFMDNTGFIDSTMREVIGNNTHYIPVLFNMFATE